ncbi:P-loop NTPase [Desulfococcaceae bacterium HSG8]|nr:P-loop NTPase [Desulfococcaceae bacterium HSG8]
METKRTIIPVASGKGGVGKSVFAANLSIALASLGHSTVAVDLDLGGSNLYTCLGLPNKYPGIGDFLKAGNIRFEELIVPTGIPNLKFLPGDGKTPFMANISYNQRITLLKELKNISARYVILDLGAGTVFNTLTFFGLAYKGMIVTSFETSSVMNFIMFLRNFIFRVISNVVRHNREALNILISAFQQPMGTGSLTVSYLLDKIADIDPKLANRVRETCNCYRPRIVFNMGDHPDELNVLEKLDNTIRQGLSIAADHFGFIFYDDMVRKAAKRKEILIRQYPDSIASQNIGHIARRVTRVWDRSLGSSGVHLIEDTQRHYEMWYGGK